MNTEKECLFRQYESDTLIEVWQQADKRQLIFDNKVIQSEMWLAEPQRLVLPLHKSMLAGCLFSDLPGRVLLAGTGGASVARYFHHQFPDVAGDAVELSPTICAIARNYFQFPSDNWQLHHQDIQAYIVDCKQQYDLIVFDIAEGLYSPKWLLDISFLQRLKQQLTLNGQIAFNILVKNDADFMQFLAAIRIVFAQQTICLSVPKYRNVVVFAFNRSPKLTRLQVEERLAQFEQYWGLDFQSEWLQMLKENPAGSGVL